MTKNQEKWFALEITVYSEAIEAVEFALNELDALGTEINNLGKKQAETVCVVGYFNKRQTDETVKAQLAEALRIYNFETDSVKRTSWRKIENKDWLEEWKKHWQPTKTGKFIIAPTWSEVSKNEKNQEIIIRIDPEMAFGTGTHETTRLCLRAIEENYKPEMSFLDVGTGTGILSIAAAKFKVQSSKFKVQSREFKDQNLRVENQETLTFEPETLNSIWACDTDENSIEIARRNAALNNVGDDINFYVGSISGKTLAFDFVCANLTTDVILPILPLLVGKARKKLVLSGILKEQESSVAEKLRELRVLDFKVQTDGEWISILIENGKRKMGK